MNYGFIDFTAKYQVAPPAGQRLQLAEAGRNCAIEMCGRKLSRLNKDHLCFRCQDLERQDRLDHATFSSLTKTGHLQSGTGRITK